LNINKQVTKVVDGDTIKVEPFADGEDSVRLLGIDTPETYYKGHSQGFHGEAAKAYLKGLLSVGDTVRIETDEEERDKYGRVLAYVYKGDQNINLKLVAEGLALPYPIYHNLKFLSEMNQLAAQARVDGKGVFDPANALTEMPFEFRMRVDHRRPHKLVGHVDTHEYYDPADYRDVPLLKRVYFFSEKDARDYGFTRRKTDMDIAHIVTRDYAGMNVEELLQAPVQALKGVSEADAGLLDQAFGIKTIGDLAENKFFRRAKAIRDLV